MGKLNWDDVEKITDKLSDKIKSSGFVPDYIIGITAGGLVPLYFLTKKLNVTKNILTVSADSYDKDCKKDLKILYLPQANLEGKKVLLVDEIAETGDTLKTISDIMIKQYKVSELKTATLAINVSKCKFRPDFYEIEEKGEWVVFPWDKAEFPEHFQ